MSLNRTTSVIISRHTGLPDRLRLSVIATMTLLTSTTASHLHAKNGGWDLEPYHIQIRIALDLPGGQAEQLTAELPRYIQRRVQAALEPLSISETQIATGPDRMKVFAAMDASEPPPPDLPADKDKLILVTVREHGDSIELASREFDRYIERWSPVLHRVSRQNTHLREQVFSSAYNAFAPLAQLELDPKDPRRVVLKPRGAALPRPAGSPPIARVGDVFTPILRRTTRSGDLEKKGGLQPVPWTFVETTEVKDNTIVGQFQSASHRPINLRRQGRVEPIAIAVRAEPEAVTLRLRSRTAADKPLIGYEVFTQRPGEETLTRVGLTDSTGQIVIAPGDHSLQYLLVKHGGQLFAKVPYMPGAKSMIDISLPDDDARLAAEASLAAVREDLIDVVARRSILMSRARQKIDKKDFVAAEELVRSINDLAARPQFDQTLRAAETKLRSDDPQMQKRIEKLFASTRALLTQYLDMRPVNKLQDDLREAQDKPSVKSASPAEKKS